MNIIEVNNKVCIIDYYLGQRKYLQGKFRRKHGFKHEDFQMFHNPEGMLKHNNLCHCQQICTQDISWHISKLTNLRNILMGKHLHSY